jgi:hypothetical protein
MPLDMPPQQVVEYRMERPAATGVSAQAARAVAAARSATASRASVIPAMDPASPAMTQADRAALEGSLRPGGMTSGSFQLPDSYVGQRLKVSMALARASASSRDDAPSPVFVRELKCRMVALAMDTRAGAYVVGGEKAAEQARRSMPPEVLKACRIVASQSQARADAASKVDESCRDAPATRQTQPRVAIAARMAQMQGRVR